MSARIASFIYAFNGLKILFKQETNARIHLLAAVIACTLSFILKISSIEWVMIIFCIGLVLALESINTAIEILCNYVQPEKNEFIKKIKDLSAASVLIGALTALVIGGIIFIPRLLDQFSL